MNTELYLGLMSGTSLDGVDLVLAHIQTPYSHTIKAFHHEPFPTGFQEEMLTAMSGEPVHPDFLIRLHGALGRFFAQSINAFLEEQGICARDIQALGMHGVTFRHCPEPGETPVGLGTGTLQLGDPHVVWAETGLPVISDFRHADMAVGGQGAPLAPFLDQLLFCHEERGRVLLNLGGIANLTFLPANGQVASAFDSGPANMIMDGLMRQHPNHPGPFDPEGIYAGKGRVLEPLLEKCLNHPYFAMKPPKSTGRKLFGEDFLRLFLGYPHDDYNDLLATAARLTADTVAGAILKFRPDPYGADDFSDLIVSGGGAHNRTVMAMLENRLPMKVSVTSDHGLNEDAKEALLMASLAWAHRHGRPGNIPAVTGAERSVVLGARVG